MKMREALSPGAGGAPTLHLLGDLERVLHLVDLQQLRTRGVSTAPRVWATKKRRRTAGGGRDLGSGVAGGPEDLQLGAVAALGYGPEASRGGGEGHGRQRRRPVNRAG
ncbi:unnamed protein product [Miscanthus lutarioriparius]|uniref:Uncharacterized protein n=1 Tax=Miscanthus lutarioriparius TaxID=422564 RepID=A0A811PPQ3_9POAL|nr:unnamed protein product [Miscanthus lutarioriparius]